jgi:hypothetical protein
VSVLDRSRAADALGERLADRFLQYARPPEEGEPQGLLLSIDAHLAEVQRAARRWPDAERHFELVERVAGQCKRLLLRSHELDADGRAAVIGGVRYFLDTLDLERDDEPFGFGDDAQVVDYVVREVAPDLAG